VCVSGLNRAGDGLPRGEGGGDEEVVWLPGRLASHAPSPAAGRLPGGSPRAGAFAPASSARATNRLQDGGPHCVEVVRKSELPVRHPPGAGRSLLPNR
jgi:hypothetical protein